MAEPITPSKETPEEAAKREAQRRQLEQESQTQDKGILGSILGFLKFLFEIFFPGNEAPNEDPPATGQPGTQQRPETVVDRLRLGQLIIDANAVPKWKAFQEAHKGEKVEFTSPVVGASVVTSGFGHRVAPTKGASTNHAGVDLGARSGDSTPPIVASASGIVLFSGEKQGYGHTVMIGHADGSYTLYGHLTGTNMPKIGAEVAQGAVIGEMGASGRATGIHLHYEQRKGTEALQPKIAGVALTEGTRVAGAKPAPSYAGLVDPTGLPKLAVMNGGQPSATAYRNGATTPETVLAR